MAKPDLRISVISDVHVTHFGAGEEAFDRALQFHSEKLPESDLYLFTGDIIYQLDSSSESTCNNVYESNYDFVMKTVNKYIPDIPKIFVVGNHEFPQNNTDPELTKKSLEVWQRKTGQPIMEHVILNDYHFIKAPIRSWAMESSHDQEMWLKNELKNALSDGDRPVFFLSHTSLHRTIGCSPKTPGSFSEDFRTFLTENPRIIHISGHMHNHILDEKCIYQEGFTSLSAPVCGVGYICMGGCNYLNPPVFDFSQSLFLEVSGNIVKVYRVDLVSQKIIGSPWIIDTSETAKGVFRYGKDRTETAKRPAFAPDAAVSAVVEESHVFADVAQKFKTFDVIVAYYKISVTNEAGETVIDRAEHTDFYNLSLGKTYADTFRLDLGEFAPGAYTLKVYAANSFFAHDGNAIECAFTVK